MKEKLDLGGWESEEDRLRRWAKVPLKKRLEWLYDMHMFMQKSYTSKQKRIFWKLREMGQVSRA